MCEPSILAISNRPFLSHRVPAHFQCNWTGSPRVHPMERFIDQVSCCSGIGNAFGPLDEGSQRCALIRDFMQVPASAAQERRWDLAR